MIPFSYFTFLNTAMCLTLALEEVLYGCLTDLYLFSAQTNEGKKQ